MSVPLNTRFKRTIFLSKRLALHKENTTVASVLLPALLFAKPYYIVLRLFNFTNDSLAVLCNALT